VLATGDGEAEDPAGVVEEVEPLGAGAGGEAGDDADLAEAAGTEGVAASGSGWSAQLRIKCLYTWGRSKRRTMAHTAAGGARIIGRRPRRSGGACPPSASAARTPPSSAPAQTARHRPHPHPDSPSPRAKASSAFALDWIRCSDLGRRGSELDGSRVYLT
jgi:hypothetical protein